MSLPIKIGGYVIVYGCTLISEQDARDTFMNPKLQHRLKSIGIKAFSYAFIYIALMLLVSLFGQKWAGGGLSQILSMGAIFGVLMGLWEWYYKKRLYLQSTDYQTIADELKRLGFTITQDNGKTIFFTRKAYEKFGFSEEIMIHKTSEWIEIEGVKKYIRHLKKFVEN